jgi:hypothetical protein
MLVEYNAEGDVVWQCSWDDNIHIYKITFDSQDNIILSGDCDSTEDFDPSPGGVDIHPGGKFLMKFGSQNNYLWAATWGGWSSWGNEMYEQVCDEENNIYLCGKFSGSVDFDHSSGVDEYESWGYFDAYVCKNSPEGEYIWTRVLSGPGEENANDLAFDSDQNLYVVGYFEYTVDFDPDPVDVVEKTAVWDDDAFILSLTHEGDFNDVKTFGTVDREYMTRIEINDNDDVFVSGQTFGIDLELGTDAYVTRESFIIKYDVNGGWYWISAWDNGLSITDLVIDRFDDIFITGTYFWVVHDFDPGPGRLEIPPVGMDDVYFIKLLPNGLWE